MQDFCPKFTLLSTEDFKYTQQRYQISFYPQEDATKIYVFSIGWHTIIQKPVIIFDHQMALMDVSTYASLRDILVDLKHSDAQINVEVGYEGYNMETLLDMPIYDAPVAQFKMFRTFDVYLFWNHYWNQQAAAQRHGSNQPYRNEDTVFSTYEHTPEDNVYDDYPEWTDMTEEDKEHISFAVALSVFDEEPHISIAVGLSVLHE